MKITKAHIQITILVISGLVVTGIWLAPEPDTPKPVTSAPTPPPVQKTAPLDIVKPKPHVVTPSLELDDSARAFIARSGELAIAKLDADIATQEERLRKASASTSKKPASYVPSVSVIGQPYTPPPSRKTVPKQAIERFTLNGLFVDGQHANAYLSFDGATPVRVRVGQTLHGVRVTHINANGVRLMQGTRARVLEGGL